MRLEPLATLGIWAHAQGRAVQTAEAAFASLLGLITLSLFPPWGALSGMAQTGVSRLVWSSMEKALWTVSSRLEAKTEVLGSVDHKFGVVVDEGSTGGIALEALSRPESATCSSTSNRASRCWYVVWRVYPDDMRCVKHLVSTLVLPHFCAASLLAGSCLS